MIIFAEYRAIKCANNYPCKTTKSGTHGAKSHRVDLPAVKAGHHHTNNDETSKAPSNQCLRYILVTLISVFFKMTTSLPRSLCRPLTCRHCEKAHNIHTTNFQMVTMYEICQYKWIRHLTTFCSKIGTDHYFITLNVIQKRLPL